MEIQKELKKYRHPNETSRFILALVFAVPITLIAIVFAVASYGILLIVIGFFLLFVWLGYETFYANFIANSIRVSESNYPRVLKILQEVNGEIGVTKKVDIFVYQQGEFNAYFKRFFYRRSIFLNSEMLEQGVSDEELEWIIGRFLGQMRSEQAKGVFGWMITLAKRLIVFNLFLLPYERATAYTGDRVALACIDGNITTAVSAMNKLLVGRGLGYSVNPAGLVEQNRDVKGSFFAFLARLFSGLPHTITRYVDLIGFAKEQFPTQHQQFVAENPSFQSSATAQPGA